MRSSRLLLLLLLIAAIRGDIFHYYKLKKLLTAVAFARVIGRRPTILPIPIPIPIPISQNEVIRLPASSAKSFLTLSGSPKYSSGGSGIYTGSSSFGYPLPGSFNSGSLGGSKVMVLDGNNLLDGGSDFASSSNVIRVLSGKSNYFPRRPGRIYLSGGGRTMRNSPYMDLAAPPMRHFNKRPPTKIQTPMSKQKKPIPVGERFRLP